MRHTTRRVSLMALAICALGLGASVQAQTACPTNAIVFGNAYDKTSQVARIREENKQRDYYVLEQLHVLPNVSYLSKVRNTDEILEIGGHAPHAEGHGEESGHAKGEHAADSTKLPTGTVPAPQEH